ncbi:MAG TPA: DUF2399 domain-containing protein [Planctomycetota bacterium]|nr:DUF2399 domain-containing protein [Planctomycetota bacterium]
MLAEADPRLDRFQRALLAGGTARLDATTIWKALATAFPHRPSGPGERELLVDALTALQARGVLRLPPPGGRRWDRSMHPAVPTNVDLVRDEDAAPGFPWRTFPWHPSLHWVARCRRLTEEQVALLRRVHDGLVHDAFREPAPMKYRSLQLTGDEKQLAVLAKTQLFEESRLTLEMLGCLPETLPLAWEAVGPGGRMLVFENAGPFSVAMRVLAEMRDRPYDLIAYGGGKSILAAIGYLKELDRRVDSLHYVGDLDPAGLEIAAACRRRAAEIGLPPIAPASELHRAMLESAAAFGSPRGWPTPAGCANTDLQPLLKFLDADLRDRVRDVIGTGRRIPEEVLGPVELRVAWNGGLVR